MRCGKRAGGIAASEASFAVMKWGGWGRWPCAGDAPSPVFCETSRESGAPSTRPIRRVARPPRDLADTSLPASRPGAPRARLGRARRFFPDSREFCTLSRDGRRMSAVSLDSARASAYAPASRGVRRAGARVVRRSPSSLAPQSRRPSAIHRVLAFGACYAREPPPPSAALRKNGAPLFVSREGLPKLRFSPQENLMCSVRGRALLRDRAK